VISLQRTYKGEALLELLCSSAMPGQGIRLSATTEALNHMVRTYQRAGNLDNASIEVWGMQKKALRRKGMSKGLRGRYAPHVGHGLGNKH